MYFLFPHTGRHIVSLSHLLIVHLIPWLKLVPLDLFIVKGTSSPPCNWQVILWIHLNPGDTRVILWIHLNIPFPSNLSANDFSIHWWSLAEIGDYLESYKTMIFYFCHSFYFYLTGILSYRGFPFLLAPYFRTLEKRESQWACVCVCVHKHTLQHVHIEHVTRHSHCSFWCSRCPRYGQWELLEAGFSVFLSTSLFSGTGKCLRLILYFSCLRPNHFSAIRCSLY